MRDIAAQKTAMFLKGLKKGEIGINLVILIRYALYADVGDLYNFPMEN